MAAGPMTVSTETKFVGVFGEARGRETPAPQGQPEPNPAEEHADCVLVPFLPTFRVITDSGETIGGIWEETEELHPAWRECLPASWEQGARRYIGDVIRPALYAALAERWPPREPKAKVQIVARFQPSLHVRVSPLTGRATGAQLDFTGSPKRLEGLTGGAMVLGGSTERAMWASVEPVLELMRSTAAGLGSRSVS